MLTRLGQAWSSHDADAVAALFASDYHSAQPLHPSRTFQGNGQVQTNWSSVFAGVPNFEATLVASIDAGETEWGEWEWRGTHADGSLFLMRGVMILLVRDGLIASARLYMEPVDSDDVGIDEAVKDLYKPPESSP